MYVLLSSMIFRNSFNFESDQPGKTENFFIYLFDLFVLFGYINLNDNSK
jgi:hypothetical protein